MAKKELDFNRYVITRDGVKVNTDTRYFVLNIDNDPHAKTAFLAYADAVEKDNPTLADEMRAELA